MQDDWRKLTEKNTEESGGHLINVLSRHLTGSTKWYNKNISVGILILQAEILPTYLPKTNVVYNFDQQLCILHLSVSFNSHCKDWLFS